MNTQKIIKGEVVTDFETRKKYSRDASIFEVLPHAIAYPKNEQDLSDLVHYAIDKKAAGIDVSLTARNGGTCMSGGPLTESIVVDMSRYFNHIGEIDLHDRTIRVQGGVMHVEVEKATHPHKLLFAPYTSSRDICGIGGMIGNNASGEKSVRYGATSSNVKSLKVMLSDGNTYEFGTLTAKQVAAKKQLPTFEGKLYREITKLIDDNWHLIEHAHPKVKKNAAGYALWDLWDAQRSHFNLGRLFIGAQGTLGITTEATLKLIPFAPYTRMIVAPIANLRDLTPVVKTILRFNPDTCETYDHFTYELAERLYPEDAERANVARGQHMVVFGIYAGDTQAHADAQAEKATQALKAAGYSVFWIEDQAAVESHLLIRRKSFKMLLENPTPDMRAMPFLEDTIVPLEHYGEFLASLEVILSDYNMTYTYAGHIGDGSIRLIPLVNVEAPDAPDKILELSQRVNDLVFAFGGSMSVDHNDGLIRTPLLERMYGEEMVTLFARVKELLDPMGIFNPHKKVGGNADYAKAHIIRSNQ